jgi:5-methylcytosine-specific restriction protein B
MSEFGDDVDNGSTDGVRRGLLTRTIYQLLAAEGGPVRSADLLSRVAEQIKFNQRELSTNDGGQIRWRTAASAALSRSAFRGWLTRDDNGGYTLTESGAEALAALPADELWQDVSRAYQASRRGGESQGIGWEPFLLWAHEFTKVIDMDAEERSYKLKAAEKWAAAGRACAGGSSDWAERLKQAVSAGNLVDQFAGTWLRNHVRDNPEEIRRAFGGLYSAGNPDAIDMFGEALGSMGDYISPGDRTVFASCLLLGVDASSFPPYRPALGQGWAKRVGGDVGYSPGERYLALLALCDGLLERWVDDETLLRDRLDAQGLGWTVMKWAPLEVWSPMKRAELQHWREGGAGEVRVERGAGVSPTMENATWEVLGAGLRGEGSTLVEGVRSWSVENARDLAARLETGDSGKFAVRLAQQLDGASDGVLCLAAELLYLRDAPLNDMNVATKVTRVSDILSSMSGAPQLPLKQAEGLADGSSFNGGPGYHMKAPEHLQWLCRFVVHWLEQSPDTRDYALRDPFAFRDVTTGVPDDSPSIRYVLEYLAWPSVFPSIVSVEHRRQIRDGLISDLGNPSGLADGDITRDLVALRTLHERKKRGFVSWYDRPYLHRWRRGAVAGTRAWLIRSDEPDDVEQWIRDGVVSLRDEAQLGLEPGMNLSTVTNRVAAGYPYLSSSQQSEFASAMYAFLDAMNEDDLVVVMVDERVVVGAIEGSAPDREDVPLLTRSVIWSGARSQVHSLPAKLNAALQQEGRVVDLTAVIDLLIELVNGDRKDKDGPRPEPPVRAMLPPVPSALAEELYMPVASLQELVTLLNRRRQLVIYGPPGTGKTYVAKKLAEALVGAQDPSRVRLVQFHPSYAYEDFFEGFRPVEKNGMAHFSLQDGPLKLMAIEAAKSENAGKAYVLIIDELNRANLAKVFGELYFLLEYREEVVRLQYRPDKPFSLPDNLFIIGTMNTADRSIALVDAAIRRRFPFYEMHPQREPVKGVLAGFARRHSVTDDRVALLGELNNAMGVPGHDLHIGPSYLMRDGLGEPGELDLVWRYDILPLLHEHFYGSKSPEAVDAEFGLPALRRRIKDRSAEPSDGAEI